MLNSKIDISKCPAYRLYNVFGIDGKGCCYLEHKYCDEVEICNFKYLQQQLQQAKQDVEKAKKYNYDAGQQLIRMSQELQQLKATLNEIEGICDFNFTKENTRILANEILQLIKQAKDGEE